MFERYNKCQYPNLAAEYAPRQDTTGGRSMSNIELLEFMQRQAVSRGVELEQLASALTVAFAKGHTQHPEDKQKALEYAVALIDAMYPARRGFAVPCNA